MLIKGNQIIGEKVRFTLLTDRLIRMEYQEDGKFEDRFTTTVVNRDFPIFDFKVYENLNGFELQIVTEYFHFYYRGGEFNGDNLFVDSKYNYGTHFNRWFYGENNYKNLKGTIRTLDRIDGEVELDSGIMSKDGYGFLDDSKSMIFEKETLIPREFEQIDLYGFFYGRNYYQALEAYYKLTGYPPIIPRFALGNWWSRFYPYNHKSYIELMDEFEAHNIPISVSVIDMDWHIREVDPKYGSGWTGYTWNPDLFPDPKSFLDDLKKRNKKISLNLHPAAGIRAFEEKYRPMAIANNIDPDTEQAVLMDFSDKNFVESYFSIVLHPMEEDGVDFWWIDWQQGGKRSKDKPDPLWLQNILHFNDQVKRKKYDALILSRYAGPGSHRYPVGFSGDTVVSWESLEFQPYFNATATNIGYTWWSNDIGGHYKGSFDPELTLRWFQLGVFSPILRLHSSDNEFIAKEPWKYDYQTFIVMKRYLQLRHRLIPYINTSNIETSKEAKPLIVPLYYEHPEEKKAFEFTNQFYFGDSLLVAPITSKANQNTNMAMVKTYLPEGEWYDYFTKKHYKGNQVLKVHRDIDKYPVFVKAGSILVENPNYMESLDKLPETLEIKLYPGPKNTYILKEFLEGKFAYTKFVWDEENIKLDISVKDEDSIIPENRKIKVSFPQSELDGEYLIEGLTGSSHDLSEIYSKINQKDIVKDLAYEFLFKTKMDFVTKEKIWQLIEKEEYESSIISITSLTESEFYEPLLEILLA